MQRLQVYKKGAKVTSMRGLMMLIGTLKRAVRMNRMTREEIDRIHEHVLNALAVTAGTEKSQKEGATE